MAQADRTCLVLEIFCSHGDSWWNMAEKDIIQKTLESLVSIKLLKNIETVRNASVKKIEYAYPLCYKDYDIYLNRVKNDLGRFNNLILAGRSGSHAYLDMEECLDDVREKIKVIL